MVVLACLALLAGCASSRAQIKPADTLLAEGGWAWAKGSWAKAAKIYGQIRDYYPYHPKATFAQLRAAEALYLSRQYIESLAAYETFQELHPTHKDMAHVLLRIGQCHYYLIPTIDRDMSEAHQAVKSFQSLKRRFPDSKEAKEAKSYLFWTFRKLVRHELLVGRFYRSDGYYEAAVGRFEAAGKYPDVGYNKVIEVELANTRPLIKGQESPDLDVPEPTPAPKDPEEERSWYEKVWDKLKVWE